MSEKKPFVARETKIGVFVITVLLVVFAVVLVRRIRRGDEVPTEVAAKEQPAANENDEAEVVSGVAGAQTPESHEDAHGHNHDHAHQNAHQRSNWRKSYYEDAQGEDSSYKSSDRYAFMPPKSTRQTAEVEQAEAVPASDDLTPVVGGDDRYAATGDAPLADPPAELQIAETDQVDLTAQQAQMLSPEEVSTAPAQHPPRFSAYGQHEHGHHADGTGQHGTTVPSPNHLHYRGTTTQTPQTGTNSPYPVQPTTPAQPTISHPISAGPGDRFAQLDRGRNDLAGPSGEGTYVVKPNDNFWTISEALYGSGSYFKALKEYNKQRHPLPDRIDVGDEVLAPSKAELVELYPGLCPRERKKLSAYGISAPTQTGGVTYVVQEGDTLFDIARYELGDPSRWVEIYKLNANQMTEDFDYVQPGMKLILPGRGGPPVVDRVTRQPDADNLQR